MQMDSGAERADPGDSEQDEEEDVYEVERIIDMRVEDGEVLYRVRWKNYSSDDDTWEPKAHLEDCSEVLLAYERSLAEKKLKKDSSMKLPMKSDLFDANSESDSDKDRLKESPGKKKKKKRKHAEDSEEEKSEKDRKKKKKKEKRKDDKPLPAPESDEEEDRVSAPLSSKKEKGTDAKKRAVEKEEDDNEDALTKKHKKEVKTKDGGKQKKEIVDERKKKRVKSKKELVTSDDETDKSDAPSELYTDDTSSTGNLSITAKPSTPKTTEKSARSESGSDHSKAKQKKNKSELKQQGFKDVAQDVAHPKKTDGSTLLLKESGLNKLKSLASSKSSSKSSRSDDEPDSSDAGATARAKNKAKGPDLNSAPQKDLFVSSSSSSSTVLATTSKPREEELKEPKESKEEAGEKGAANNLFEKFLLNCEAKDRAPRKTPAHTTPKNPVKTDKKSRKESPVQKPEFDKVEKAKEGTIGTETDERQEKTTQESEKSDRANESVAKTKEDLQREQKEEEQRRRKERLEEEEKKRKERLEESQRERKVRMEEAQRERQRLAEEARLDRLDRRSVMDAMASAESSEDSRWKERRRKRREDSESRLLITCDDNQDSQDPLERSNKTPDRGPPSLNLGVELKLDWMTLEDFQRHLNGEDENLSPLNLTPTELRDAVKNGNYMAVKRALSSKEDYNLDQEDSSGMSLCMLASAGGQDDILRLLIKKGVKVNGRQKNGTTALMHAAEKSYGGKKKVCNNYISVQNFLTTVAILLEAGSCLNAQTLGGETALMKACRRGNADVVRLLLEYGADCNILSKHKTTALHFAKLSNNMIVYDLIKDHIQMLSTVAEETIRAYFETRFAVLEPVFPLACHRLCEGPDFSLEFSYKPPQHSPGEGSGILLFIFHANFMTEITARLCGPCSVHAVILNDNFQLPVFLDSHFIYSFNPVHGVNKLFVRLAESPTAKVKLLIGAYRVQLP